MCVLYLRPSGHLVIPQVNRFVVVTEKACQIERERKREVKVELEGDSTIVMHAKPCKASHIN